MESSAVKLVIKAPNQQIKDQVVDCDSNWTIRKLKEHLAEVYPSKPERTAQKLIYAGQLLTDSLRLKDVLRSCDGQEEQLYIVHLVCALQKTATIKATPEQSTETRSAEQRVNCAQTQGQSQPPQLYSQQYLDPRNNQQMAWMQQAYTHYFTQYMQLMAAQGIQLQTSIPYVQQMNEATDGVQNATPNANAANEEQQQVAAQDAENAGNNAAEDGAFNRDWLDFFYMLSRIIVLFSIVYFYSSPLRFLIVTFLGFAMYLYQGGFFRVQPLLPENNNIRANNNNQALQNEAPQQQNQAQAVQDTRTNANEEHEEERPGALAFTWTFFSTFFASLIPDQPNVI